MAGRKGQRGRKPAEVPARFTEAFLENMDGRTAIAKELRRRLDELESDLGGRDSLSYTQRSLCRRLIHLEALVEIKENALVKGEPVDIGSLVQSVNSLLGLCKTLGLQRRAKEVDLATYLRRKAEEKGGEN